LTNIYRTDQIPAIDSMGTTGCWRPLGPWGPRLKPT